MKSSTSYSNQRVGIFVDVQNLYHSARNLYHGRVNYKELIKHLVSDRQLIRAMAYVVKSEGIISPAAHETDYAGTSAVRSQHGPTHATGGSATSSEAAFFEALENAGLELRVKDLQVYAGGMKKADWDVGMAVDAIRMSSFLDVVILVTGDGDFIPLVEYLKWGAGRFVEVAAFKRSASGRLQESTDKFINIEEIPKIILRK